MVKWSTPLKAEALAAFLAGETPAAAVLRGLLAAFNSKAVDNHWSLQRASGNYTHAHVAQRKAAMGLYW